jgi:hypothetical protein
MNRSDNSDKYDIFFSYSHEDKDAVMPICSALQTEGLEVWIDKTKVKEGESIIVPASGS